MTSYSAVMDSNRLQNIFAKHSNEGCIIVSWEEWVEKVTMAYADLIGRAKSVPYDRITITYSELGGNIGLTVISEYFHLKIAWILYACDAYAKDDNLPMITALVVNHKYNRPSRGFWGLDRIPKQLRTGSKMDGTEFLLSPEQETFWITELKKIDKWGKGT